MSRVDINTLSRAAAAAAMAYAAFAVTAAGADPLGFAAPFHHPNSVFEPVLRDAGNGDAVQDAANLPARLRRQVVDYSPRETPGTIVVDTPNTYLYYVLAGGRAVRYGIGVGREGFTWSGVKVVDRKAEWPDWIPPAEMLARQPYLPRFMAGGPGNPLGARAMYLSGTAFRIHGTNAPSTIGQRVSSGCIRMLNQDVVDLYSRVNVGTKVVVLPMQPRRSPDVASRQLVSNPSSVAVAGTSRRSELAEIHIAR